MAHLLGPISEAVAVTIQDGARLGDVGGADAGGFGRIPIHVMVWTLRRSPMDIAHRGSLRIRAVTPRELSPTPVAIRRTFVASPNQLELSEDRWLMRRAEGVEE